MMAVRFGPGAFRLVLAALVFVSHVSRLNLGRAAVILFFMLSGFWVTRLFDLRRDHSVVPYLRDRFLRVWPLLTVVATAIALAAAITGRPPVGSLGSTIGLLGLATRGDDVIGTAWSLDIEMQFYLALPLVAYAVSRVPLPGRAATAAVAVALATALGAALLARGVVTVLAYTPAFAAGALVWRNKWAPGGRAAAVSLGVFVAVVVISALAPGLRWTVIKSGSLPWWFDLSQIVVCAVLLPFVAWNVNQPSPATDRHLGNLSYPFYLVHFPLIAAVGTAFASAISGKAAAFGLSVAATLLLYAIVDRPLERVRKVALRRRRTTADAPVLTRGGHGL